MKVRSSIVKGLFAPYLKQSTTYTGDPPKARAIRSLICDATVSGVIYVPHAFIPLNITSMLKKV